MIRWIAASLSRKLLFALILGMAITSVLFLALVVGLYHERLASSRAEVSGQVNRLLQVSLENAMLKRDLPGLSNIVDRLATLDRIANVMILNPAGEVRFTSNKDQLGTVFERSDEPGCVVCFDTGGRISTAMTVFVSGEEGQEVLRSVNPVPNKEPCRECHGTIAENPVNGILVVDYEAAGIRREALASAATLSAFGASVMAFTLLVAWLLMRRVVLRPLKTLSRASQDLTQGDMAARVEIPGNDEFTHLGNRFNAMATSLQESIREIRENERFLQDVIDSDPDGIRIISEDFRIIAANRRFCELVDMPIADVLSQPCFASSHKRQEPCAAALTTCPVLELADNSTPVKCTQRFIDASGGQVFVEITAAPVTLKRDGKPVRAVVESIRDLSQEMRISHGFKLSELAQLATGVAHEVHNPLAAARISVQSILRLCQDGTPAFDEIHDYLRVLDAEIDKCVEVTAKLLRLAEPPPRYTQPVRIDDAVSDVVTLLKPEGRANEVDISVTFDHKDLRAMATESEIRMVILNLVQNAFHAMTESGTLVIRGWREAGYVKLAVQDTGVGIEADRLKRIFEPFFTHRADQRGGTGLGLSICKAIIDRFHGALDVTSEPGVGTTFTVSLPDADDEGTWQNE